MFSFMEYSTSLHACRLHLSALMTTTTLYRDTELRLSARMKFSNVSMRAKRKRLMSSSKEYSRPRRNLINLIELLSKLKSITKL